MSLNFTFFDEISPIMSRAYCVAVTAHSAINQRRKYSDEPYIVHPVDVARRVIAVFGTGATAHPRIAAALLHDVVEDTGVSQHTINELFPADIARMVDDLTDKLSPADGNRAFRKAVYAVQVSNADGETQDVKLCDIMSNASNIMTHDQGFGFRWITEARIVIASMQKCDSALKSTVEQHLATLTTQQHTTK